MNDKTYLGPLCKHEHRWQDTEQSLRYTLDHSCVECRTAYKRENGPAQRQARYEDGLCEKCSRPRVPNSSRCQFHIDQKIARDARNRKTKTKELNEKEREYRLKNRALVLEHYGGRCVCCGITESVFLTIDHIDGNAQEHRKLGSVFYVWIRTHGYPDTLQLMCWNCNITKGKLGFCPHRPDLQYPPSRPSVNTIHTRAYQRQRQAVLNAYGRICACCGEREESFLTIDHIDGGGRAHLKTIKISLYKWLKKMDYSEGLQTLCYNCNEAKALLGTCPHRSQNAQDISLPHQS